MIVKNLIEILDQDKTKTCIELTKSNKNNYLIVRESLKKNLLKSLPDLKVLSFYDVTESNFNRQLTNSNFIIDDYVDFLDFSDKNNCSTILHNPLYKITTVAYNRSDMIIRDLNKELDNSDKIIENLREMNRLKDQFMKDKDNTIYNLVKENEKLSIVLTSLSMMLLINKNKEVCK
jgi:hypothetical protein